MTIWLDAHLPPKLALWFEYRFGIKAVALRDIGLRDATDMNIFERAKAENAVIMSKDRDFMELYFRFGAPPKIIILNCGNLTNKYLQEFLSDKIEKIIAILGADDIVEVG